MVSYRSSSEQSEMLLSLKEETKRPSQNTGSSFYVLELQNHSENEKQDVEWPAK